MLCASKQSHAINWANYKDKDPLYDITIANSNDLIVDDSNIYNNIVADIIPFDNNIEKDNIILLSIAGRYNRIKKGIIKYSLANRKAIKNTNIIQPFNYYYQYNGQYMAWYTVKRVPNKHLGIVTIFTYNSETNETKEIVSKVGIRNIVNKSHIDRFTLSNNNKIAWLEEYSNKQNYRDLDELNKDKNRKYYLNIYDLDKGTKKVVTEEKLVPDYIEYNYKTVYESKLGNQTELGEGHSIDFTDNVKAYKKKTGKIYHHIELLGFEDDIAYYFVDNKVIVYDVEEDRIIKVTEKLPRDADIYLLDKTSNENSDINNQRNNRLKGLLFKHYGDYSKFDFTPNTARLYDLENDIKYTYNLDDIEKLKCDCTNSNDVSTKYAIFQRKENSKKPLICKDGKVVKNYNECFSNYCSGTINIKDYTQSCSSFFRSTGDEKGFFIRNKEGKKFPYKRIIKETKNYIYTLELMPFIYHDESFLRLENTRLRIYNK